MPLTGSTATSRRAITEALAEARARTLLLVSPLTNEEMRRRPEAEIESVLEELEQIVRFEESALLDAADQLPIESYDEWFDRMMDVRQRVLERLNSTDAPPDVLPARDRYVMVLEHEYRQN
ncbi:MAG: DinB family protein, partial [Gemmatimonadales bacterium]